MLTEKVIKFVYTYTQNKIPAIQIVIRREKQLSTLYSYIHEKW